MCYSKWRTDDFETSAIVYCIGVWLLWLKLNELSSAPAGRVHARASEGSVRAASCLLWDTWHLKLKVLDNPLTGVGEH